MTEHITSIKRATNEHETSNKQCIVVEQRCKDKCKSVKNKVFSSKDTDKRTKLKDNSVGIHNSPNNEKEMQGERNVTRTRASDVN